MLNIETIENLYRNSELIDRMLEESENPKLLDEPIVRPEKFQFLEKGQKLYFRLQKYNFG